MGVKTCPSSELENKHCPGGLQQKIYKQNLLLVNFE